jgi:hypothetical protein
MKRSTTSGAAVRRILVLVSCLGAMVLALYSCSMHASVSTDGAGHVVEVSSVRIESSLARVAVAMLVAGGQGRARAALDARLRHGRRRRHRQLSRRRLGDTEAPLPHIARNISFR